MAHFPAKKSQFMYGCLGGAKASLTQRPTNPPPQGDTHLSCIQLKCRICCFWNLHAAMQGKQTYAAIVYRKCNYFPFVCAFLLSNTGHQLDEYKETIWQKPCPNRPQDNAWRTEKWFNHPVINLHVILIVPDVPLPAQIGATVGKQLDPFMGKQKLL